MTVHDSPLQAAIDSMQVCRRQAPGEWDAESVEAARGLTEQLSAALGWPVVAAAVRTAMKDEIVSATSLKTGQEAYLEASAEDIWDEAITTALASLVTRLAGETITSVRAALAASSAITVAGSGGALELLERWAADVTTGGCR
ncbi:hypothetical protein F8O07_06730 [Pseudoclavibacter sp. CFCC 13796]|uniref:hypothetical protein n=1 Tax=Pseudoclavibacter sp. CFCC 13796 TaxID=2615179 RepID=UPI0013017D3A|nr:hypothetical protein [Pseudoclavibacter sp. CFCC 13796]KAB1661594.1 hypothetical protein F8O07_06730 [Pseudoclavibacter sp. CFCC 13796]